MGNCEPARLDELLARPLAVYGRTDFHGVLMKISATVSKR